MEQHVLPDKVDSPDAESKTATRYVLSGQPTGWAAMAQTMREYDEDKVRFTKEDIDTLLTFVRYFCFYSPFYQSTSQYALNL